ncbi:MAG: FAD:protein FMN transferase [Oscillibacter sp.]
MKRLLAICLAAALAAGLSGCGTLSPDQAHESIQTFAMDTAMIFSAYGENGTKAAYAAEAEVQRLDALLSRTREDSPVSRLNRGEGAAVDVGAEVCGLMQAAERYGRATGGAFDITIAPVASAWGFTEDAYRVPDPKELETLLPAVGTEHIHLTTAEGASSAATASLDVGSRIDLGGIAKGYASDRVAEIFREQAVPSGMVSLGGNVWVCGRRPDGKPWRVGIQDPNNSENYAGILNLSDAFAVTSGGYQRFFEENGKIYHHIIDPATGYPAESGLQSVTVVTDGSEDSTTGGGTMCDALSTALFVMGEDRALEFWRSGAFSFDLVLITADGRVVVTQGLEGAFEEVKESGYSYEIAH